MLIVLLIQMSPHLSWNFVSSDCCDIYYKVISAMLKYSNNPTSIFAFCLFLSFGFLLPNGNYTAAHQTQNEHHYHHYQYDLLHLPTLLYLFFLHISLYFFFFNFLFLLYRELLDFWLVGMVGGMNIGCEVFFGWELLYFVEGFFGF